LLPTLDTKGTFASVIMNNGFDLSEKTPILAVKNITSCSQGMMPL
jgi:hypothetical protein